MPGSKRKKKITRLSDLDADEVSIVPVGANKRSFLITKSLDEEDEMNETIKKILEADLKNEAEIDSILKGAKLSEDQMKTVKAAVRLLNSVKEAVPGDVMKKLSEMVGVKPDEVDKKKTQKELLEELRKEGYKIEEPKKEEPKMDEKTKAYIDSIQKESSDKLEKMEKDNSDLREALKKERDLRITKELKEKAEGFGYHGEQAEKIAKSLRVAQEKMTDEEYKEYEAIVKSGAKQNDNLRKLFKENGSSQGGAEERGENFENKLKVAKEAVQKAHPEWSEQKVEDEALMKNPELYKEYLDANPAQGGY